MSDLDLTVVVVTYGDLERVRGCLRSVMREVADLRAEVIVVDNASNDGTGESVSREFPDIRVMLNSRNRGFAAANNQAIRESRGSYILLLNPDTELHPGAIGAVMSFLAQHPEAWVAGCRLVSGDGTLQCSVGAFPSVLEGLLRASFLYLLLPGNAVIGNRGIRMFDYASPAPVDWVMGAFFMVRRVAFEALGELDEQFFMYSEEVDFCQRVRNCGREVWYTPGGTVTHFWGGMNAVSGRTLLWLVASQLLYLRKHSRGMRRWVLTALKFASLAIRTVVYALSGFLTLNRGRLGKARYACTTFARLLISSPADVWPAR